MSAESPDTPPSTSDRYMVASRGEPVQLPRWMTGEDADEPLTREEHARLTWNRHRGKLRVGFVALVVLALVGATAVVGNHFVDRLGGVTQPTSSPVPTSAVGEPRDLFAGSKAEDFAVGESALVLPAATAQRPFTASEVGAALTSVRKALIEARLDLSMRLGDSEPFLALLAPDARKQLAPDFDGYVFLNYATRIGSRHPRSTEVRAKGTMTYRATTDGGGVPVLEITTEYVWVYAFDVPRTTPAQAGLVAVRDKVVWHLPRADDVRPAERGLWLVSAEAGTSNADCSRLKEGFLTVHPWMGGPGSFEPC
jgi:hypothetical protein